MNRTAFNHLAVQAHIDAEERRVERQVRKEAQRRRQTLNARQRPSWVQRSARSAA